MPPHGSFAKVNTCCPMPIAIHRPGVRSTQQPRWCSAAGAKNNSNRMKGSFILWTYVRMSVPICRFGLPGTWRRREHKPEKSTRGGILPGSGTHLDGVPASRWRTRLSGCIEYSRQLSRKNRPARTGAVWPPWIEFNGQHHRKEPRGRDWRRLVVLGRG